MVSTLQDSPTFKKVLASQSSLTGCYERRDRTQLAPNRRSFNFQTSARRCACVLHMGPVGNVCGLCYCYCGHRCLRDRFSQYINNVHFVGSDCSRLFHVPSNSGVEVLHTSNARSREIYEYVSGCRIRINEGLFRVYRFTRLVRRGNDTMVPLQSSLPRAYCRALTSAKSLVVVQGNRSNCCPASVSTKSGRTGEGLTRRRGELKNISGTRTRTVLTNSVFK